MPRRDANASRALQAVAAKGSGGDCNTMNAEPFLNGSSGVYVEQMYESWRRDPSSVHASWSAYFKNVDAGARPGEAFQSPPALATQAAATTSALAPRPSAPSAPATQSHDDVNVAIHDHLKIQLLIRSFQAR